MDNYEHEIACPNNKGIRNYLWYDYFHDSTIDNLSFDCRKGLLTLQIVCHREIEFICNEHSDAHVDKPYAIDENTDNFTYILRFKGVKHFREERLVTNGDYINGRFKDTAILRKLSAVNKQPLFHFRIQIADGYMDIIFSNFIVIKKSGRAKCPAQNVDNQTNKPLTDADYKMALDGEDFNRFFAMQRLFKGNGFGLLEIARSNLRLDVMYETSCLYSAYLLGKFGDTSDTQNLFDLLLNIEEHIVTKSTCRSNVMLIGRNIMDAIELIHYRNTKNFCAQDVSLKIHV